jgi:predicted transcriptional regulator
MAEHGLDQPGMFRVVHLANGLSPKPITAKSLFIVNPYTNPSVLNERLEQAAKAGLIEPLDKGEYKLTEQGNAALDVPNHAFYTRLSEIEALPTEDMVRLEELMTKVAEACRAADEPAEKPLVSIIFNGHPEQAYGPLAKIDQRLDDLQAFRDDVHVAAFMPYGVSGQSWEALTFVWRNDARTAEALQERLNGRGHNVETYQGVLDELAAAGWMEKGSEGYQLTEKGKSLRQEAEEQTDDTFYAPWAVLSGFETAQVHTLLTRLRDKLQELSDSAGEED